MNYYELLECTDQSSYKEIKKAFQELALKYHPDKLGGNKNKFLKINEAWKTLRDESLRKNYDLYLKQTKINDQNFYFDSIILSNMTETTNNYFYKCRCGGEYILEKNEIDGEEFIINCNECSFYLQVGKR